MALLVFLSGFVRKLGADATSIEFVLAVHTIRLSHLKLPALSAGHRHLSDYPTPSLLYGLWGFGSLGGIGLQVQIVTGPHHFWAWGPMAPCSAPRSATISSHSPLQPRFARSLWHPICLWLCIAYDPDAIPFEPGAVRLVAIRCSQPGA